ncbi:6662_t:CDS:2 [Diversispora eburnea]|uniref:6662_t:CDS:1 n=1 Tax=Diversispora eburnea TaxID=1213867 RepID=A0A9N8VSC6_9GLOM|nr:6662_t:CDS:2 [Diversispora eburnea]
MSLNINYQNIKVPFPPTISVDEIVNIHLKNGIENGNKTMNAFMIYRKEYNNIVAKFNLSRKMYRNFYHVSSEQNSLDFTYLDQNADCSLENDTYVYLTMDDDELMNHLSEDMALTYKAIIQSLPF